MSKNRTIITLMLVTSMTIMAGATLAPSLPGIERHFSDTPNAGFLTRLLLTIPSLVIALCAPLVGWVADRFGRKRILVSSIGLYVVAGSSGLYLDSLASLLVGRAVLGLGVAGTLTCATTLVGDYFTGATRTHVVGLSGAVSAFGGVIFLTLGGVLAELGWRVPFAIYLIPLALIPLALSSLREPERSHEHDDLPPPRMAARTAALIGVIYVVMFTVQVSFFMVPVQLPFYVKGLGVENPSLAGIALATMTLFAAFVAVSFRTFDRLFTRPAIVGISLALTGLGLCGVSWSRVYWHVIVAMAVGGSGMGLNFPNLANWLLDRAPAMARGRAIGGLNTSAFIGQFFSPVIAAPIIAASGLGSAYLAAGLVMFTGAAAFALAAIYKRLAAPPVHE